MRKFLINPSFDRKYIVLDGRMKASLDWSKEEQEAVIERENGHKIIWQIELGLFANLDLPLSNQTQFHSLCLSMEYFRDNLWKKFQENTEGLVIYSGDLDFSKKFPWDEILYTNWWGWLEDRFATIEIFNDECGLNLQRFNQVDPKQPDSTILSELTKLFCRDTAADYLNLLVGSLPDSIPFYLNMRVSEKIDPLLFYQLSTPERFERFKLIINSEYGEYIGYS